jgi:hypothetical protein
MSASPFRSDAEDLRLTELARIALTDERPVLGEMLRELLVRKFSNPMQGIFGAHLMLLARERAEAPVRSSDLALRPDAAAAQASFDPEMFDTVVSNLRGLVGKNHPDVEALSLACRDPKLRTTAVFTVPPILRRSWTLMVQASNERPDILPAPLWDRVIARAMTAPFLSWLVVSEAQRAALIVDMTAAVDSHRRMYQASGVSSPAAGLANTAFDPALKIGSFLDAFRRRVSDDLEIPRTALDRMLNRP